MYFNKILHIIVTLQIILYINNTKSERRESSRYMENSMVSCERNSVLLKIALAADLISTPFPLCSTHFLVCHTLSRICKIFFELATLDTSINFNMKNNIEGNDGRQNICKPSAMYSNISKLNFFSILYKRNYQQ